MPRQVDHGQRRLQIAHAVWSVMATRGLDAVSLRSVAAEAGISMGRVQHYFPSKDAMILHACEAMAQAAREQALGAPPDAGPEGGADEGGAGPEDGADEDGGAGPEGGAEREGGGAERDGGADRRGDTEPPASRPSPGAVVRSVLLVGLPHDETRRLGAGVWFGFLTKAAVWPELAAVVRSQLDGAHDFVSTVLRESAAAGSLRRGVDPTAEAVALLAMADGLVLRVMVGALDPEVAIAAVDERLAQVFARDGDARADAR